MLKAILKRMLTVSVAVALLFVYLSASNTSSSFSTDPSYGCSYTDALLEEIENVHA